MFYVLVLALAALGTFGLVQHRRHVAWGQPLVIAATVALLIACLWRIFSPGTAANEEELARLYTENQVAYQTVASEKLGRHLAQHHAGAKALVILPLPFRHSPKDIGARTDGLKRGLGDSVTVVDWHRPKMPDAYDQLDAERPDTKRMAELPPVFSLYTAEYIDELTQRSAGRYDLLISLNGLPLFDVSQITFWRQPGRPRIAVLGHERKTIEKLLQSGLIDVAVVSAKGGVFTPSSIPGDLEEAFARRFELLTSNPK
ncbi:MAG: hypothetical protein OER86_13105 [Phycisphaerae bacterium]|nr:hypothetical protein [Phycisphaerae bacterium]